MASTEAAYGYFNCTRLNSDTFLIVENDHYDEHPFIYIKIYEKPSLIVISDTGCGGHFDAARPSHSTLCDFLETCAIPVNDNRPLNPRDAAGKTRKKYFVICTHCHYDHILGLPFLAQASPTILASSYRKSFVTEKLSEHSLCDEIGVDTPRYEVTYWADDYERLTYEGHELYLQTIHTPGHTPDELAWYDEKARDLYVGDSLYERVAEDKSYEQAIQFPKEGNMNEYLMSLDKLIHFVEDKDAEEGRASVKLGSGHVTRAATAKEILVSVKTFLLHVINGRIPMLSCTEKRGELYGLWIAPGDDPRFSVEGPLRLFERVRGAGAAAFAMRRD